jgi:hypothetical protein
MKKNNAKKLSLLKKTIHSFNTREAKNIKGGIDSVAGTNTSCRCDKDHSLSCGVPTHQND